MLSLLLQAMGTTTTARPRRTQNTKPEIFRMFPSGCVPGSIAIARGPSRAIVCLICGSRLPHLWPRVCGGGPARRARPGARRGRPAPAGARGRRTTGGERRPGQRPQRPQRPPGPELRVHRARERPVKIARKQTREEGIQIVALASSCAFRPVAPAPVRGNLVPGKRVADGDADLVGRQLADQLPGHPDLAPALFRIAKLQEEADPEPGGAQPRHRAAHLRQRDPLVHRVEHRLRARLDAHPGLGAAGPAERADVLLGHEVGAGLAEEWRGQRLGRESSRRRGAASAP